MREEKETAQIVYSQNRCSINSQSGQRVFLTWVSKGNTGDGAQVDAFAIGCSMQLAGKHQDEQYEPGPSHGCVLGSHKAYPALCPSIYLLSHSNNSRQLLLKSWLAENWMQVTPFAYEILDTDALWSEELHSHWVGPSESMLLSPDFVTDADSLPPPKRRNDRMGNQKGQLPFLGISKGKDKSPISTLWTNT